MKKKIKKKKKNSNKNELLAPNNEESESNDEISENESGENEFYKLNNLTILKVYLNFLIYELDIMIKILIDENDKDKIEKGYLI